MKPKSSLRNFLFSSALLASVTPLYAVDYLWDGGGGDASWGTAGNWNATPTFNATNGVIFNSAGAARLSNFLGTGRTIGSLSFNSNATSAVTIRLATSSGGSVAADLTLGSGSVAPTITMADSGVGVTHTIGVAGGNVILANNLSVTINGGNTNRQITISRPITETGGNYGITLNGSGQLYLNDGAASTFTGKVVVNGGRLRVSGAGSLGSAPGSYVADQLTLDGGGLYYAGNVTPTDPAATLSLGNRGITLGSAGGHVITNNGNTFKIDGLIAGAGDFTLNSFSTGHGTVELLQANIFKGKTVIQKGILSLAHADALQNSAFDTTTSVTGDSNQGLRTNQTSLKLGGLIGNKNLSDVFTNASGGYSNVTSLTLNPGEGKTHTYSGAIDGTRSLTKTGLGTQILSGTNGYTGATAVNGGTLEIAVGGSTAAGSAVTVNNSGSQLIVNGTVNGSLAMNANTTLSGSGTIVGAATVSGNLNPGNSPGTMTYQNTLTMASTTITTMEIDGLAGAGVTGGHDFINLTGTDTAGVLTYGGSLILDIGTTLGVGTYVWNLFDFANETEAFTSITLADQYNGTLLDGNSDGIWDLTSGNNTWTFSELNGQLGLTVIPEPSVALLGGIGVLFVLRRRR